jgi:7-cyano-7-deazaguanine synthase
MSKRTNKKAVVLLSGGMDSATTLALAKAEGFEIYALSFDYMQRHRIELESAKVMADAMKAKKHLIVSFDLREIGGSALTSETEVPKKNVTARTRRSVEDAGLPFTTSGLIPVTYVPARNTIFLSFALAWAEVLGTGNIFIGANAVDYSGYPDCRPEYLHAFEHMANLATKASVEGKLRFVVSAPLISMKKAEIIRKGLELGLDYALTWSCYDPQPLKRQRVRGKGQGAKNILKVSTSVLPHFHPGFVPCGLCDSCRLRAKGFSEAGLEDPLASLYDI